MSTPISKQHRPTPLATAPRTPTMTAARRALLTRLSTQVPFSRLADATRPFSNAQLARLARAGVRLELAARDELHGARADYRRADHLVRVGANATLDDVRHELAHAWDDVRNDVRLRDGSWRGRSDTDVFGSQVDRRFTDAFEQYRSGPARGRGLATPGQSSTQAAQHPHEFYATGFAMFHSDDPALRDQLRATSPRLYALLLSEAASIR